MVAYVIFIKEKTKKQAEVFSLLVSRIIDGQRERAKSERAKDNATLVW